MAKLKVISEITTAGGPFHSACQLLYDKGAPEWRGFQPLKGVDYFTEGCPGVIDHSDRSAFINHHVTFDVGRDQVLHQAKRAAFRDYNIKNDVYAFGNRDCVNFVRDFAGYCGLANRYEFEMEDLFDAGRLAAKHGPDMLPYSLLVKLYKLNRDKVVEDNLL